MTVEYLDLADSALHAPAAGFGETEFYPDFVDKAAVLIVGSRRTIHCPTGTSAWRGSRCGCSWRSTADRGPSVRRLTRRSRPCSRSPRSPSPATRRRVSGRGQAARGREMMVVDANHCLVVSQVNTQFVGSRIFVFGTHNPSVEGSIPSGPTPAAPLSGDVTPRLSLNGSTRDWRTGRNEPREERP
jgi:hypothetical protein